MTFGSLLALVGWILVVTPIAIAALLFLLVRSSGSWGRGFGPPLRSPSRWLLVPVVVFLLVAGIGAVTSYVGHAPGSGSRNANAPSHSGPDGEMLARLKDFTRSIGAEEPRPAAAPAKPLPDVNTMIDRLAARLEITPGDIKGWRMLGWSYFNTGRYEQAAAAYAKAVQIDPSSADLKASYEEAKAKASAAGTSVQTQAAGKGIEEALVAKGAEAVPGREHNAAIRAMVDGLAHRLESSPRDVEGWARLMRSRVVLGEREVAAIALRKALDVFRDDSAATSRLTAAAVELGLKAE